jgi:long-chain acyl-CoA synthetase
MFPFNSLKECLENWTQKAGGKSAIEYIDVENPKKNWNCNFNQLNNLIGKARNYLVLEGIKAGDAIAFAYENSPEVILLSWAAWIMGVKTVPLDTKRDDSEMMEYKTNLAGAKILFSSKKIELQSKIKQLVLSVNEISKIKIESYKDQGKIELSSEALILFTSGTTARPKGVLLTQENLVANADGIADWLKITQKDKFMITLPLHHINSTTMCLATFLKGGSVVLTSRYSNSGFWKIAAESGATLTSVVPTIIHDQLSQVEEYSRLKNEIKLSRIQLGSAPVIASEAENFVNLTKIPLIQGYGQTETALRSTGVKWDQKRPLSQEYWNNLRSNTIGSEMKWTKVTVLKSDGTESKQEEEGEICVKGPVIMKEYIKNPDETKKVFAFGRFHSGDLGYWKMNGPEKQFFIKGRLKEIIIKAGTNVSPLFVEKSILRALPDIDQVYVIGIPDERVGEEIGAVVVWKEINRGIRDIREMGQIAGLSKFEIPKYWFNISAADLPMTSTGKVQRVKLKQMFSESYVIAETKNHVFRRLAVEEAGLTEQARQIHNIGWQPLSVTEDEWSKELKEKFLIGAVNKINGDLDGYIRCQKLNKSVIADALSVKGKSFNQKFSGKLPKATIQDVNDYLNKSIDPVVNFHKLPKAGLKSGARVLKIIPQARPRDLPALGFGVLMEYPPLERVKPAISDNASLGQQLVETALIFAKKQNISSVQVLTRPVKLLEWMENLK